MKSSKHELDLSFHIYVPCKGLNVFVLLVNTNDVTAFNKNISDNH